MSRTNGKKVQHPHTYTYIITSTVAITDNPPIYRKQTQKRRHENQYTHSSGQQYSSTYHSTTAVRIANGQRMSNLNTCASSDVEVDVGAEGSDEDHCEELQQPEEVEVTLDVCQSSKTCPLPKAGGPPATDPPCRSNDPLAVLLVKEACWHGCPVPAHTKA